MQIFLFFTTFSVFDNFFFTFSTNSCRPAFCICDIFARLNQTAMDNNSVKENIKKTRRASGLSQSDMADRLGLSRTAYNNLEQGETKLISSKVEQIAEILNTTSEELVLGYKPFRKDSGKLKDIHAEFDAAKAEMVRRHTEEISKLQKQVETLSEYVEILKDSNRTKDEIISMLKKKLADESQK